MKALAAAFLVGVALSSAGASAQRPSACCGEDFDPQWSADGSHIAFIRRDETGSSTLYAMASGGGDATQLLSLGSEYQPNASRQRPLLSRDWTRLALIQENSALKIESLSSADVHEIGTNVVSFAWSPDGRHIAFHETDLGNNNELYVVERDGTGLRSLGPGKSPAWSPTGDRLTFVDPGGRLYVMQADGTGRRRVFDGNGAIVYEPSWSPRGNWIAFYSASTLWVVELNGRVVAYISTDYELKPPQWSFDGTLVAVEAPPQLSAFRIATREHWQFDGRRDATWSPVENELATSFDGPCQRFGIYRMSLPSTSRRLTLDCHIRGTDNPDVLNGTPYRDIITGMAGDDELSGGGGQDRLIGGTGDDTLLGGDRADRLEGGYGADLLIGGAFPQDIYTDVDDWLFGGPGPDDLRGGPGQDDLSGDGGNDVIRAGRDADLVFGGPGNDRIFASGDTDGTGGQVVRDVVRCGAGRHDIAYIDRADRVSGCELVHRR